jgi:hypothetical protein
LKACQVSAASLLALLLLNGRARATPSVAALTGASGPDAALDHFTMPWATAESLGSPDPPQAMPATVRLFSGAVGLAGIDAGLGPAPSFIGTVADAIPRVASAGSQGDGTGNPSVFVARGGGFSVADSLGANQEAASQTFTYTYVPAARRRAEPADKAAAQARGALAEPGPVGQGMGSNGPMPIASTAVGGSAAGDVGGSAAGDVGVSAAGVVGAGAGRITAGTLPVRSGDSGGLAGDDSQAPPTGVLANGTADPVAAPAISTVLVHSTGAPGLTRLFSLAKERASGETARLAISRPWPVDSFAVNDGEDGTGEAFLAGVRGISQVPVPLALVVAADAAPDPTLSIYADRPTGPGVANRLTMAIDGLRSLSGPEIASFGVLGTALAGLVELWRRRRRSDSET